MVRRGQYGAMRCGRVGKGEVWCDVAWCGVLRSVV